MTHWIEWAIVLIPFSVVMWLGVNSRKYIRGVSDFLVAGRVAGRYVISVSGMESALGVITLISMVEANYATGFSMVFWQSLLLPLGMFLSLTGFCAYRFRETKALSIGQFLEMRYSRSFRIAATALRTTSEMLCNMIGPAVAARFFIYLLGFPHFINLFGFRLPTFMILLALILALALVLILSGGQISLIVTDCIQGLICYPIFVIFTIHILTNFSWFGEVTPVMIERAPGESFINPYDISNLRDFNLFALVVSLIGLPLNRAVWYGNGTSGAGRTPHEQKIAGMLGEWRAGLSAVMGVLIAVSLITIMNHANFRDEAHEIRRQLSTRVADEIVIDKRVHDRMVNRLEQIEAPQKEKMENTRLQRENNYETAYLDTALASLTDNMADSGRANQLFQQYRSLYNQNMLPVMMRNILPPILLALFVLLMLMLMVSTDDSRIFNSAATIVQDIIVPLRKTPFTPEGQVRLIRWMTAGVAILFFFGSIYLSQMDYIRLFTAITTSIWVGGAGSVMTFGLYSRFGTTAGAYASLITGTFISGGGFLVQRGWAATVYPWLVRHDLLPIVEKIMTTLSRPLEPYVVWRMNPIKFPINSTEIFFIAMASSVSMYCLFSLLTYRRPYNLERLLHRGKYNFDGDDKNITSRWTLRTVFSKLIGITPDYTPGDKVIAWSLFLYTFGYKFLLAFVLVVIWNEIMPWNTEMWGKYFFVTQVLIPGPLGAVTTVWFMIGGAFDLRRLFRDLAARKENYLDNGMVAHRVSLADQAAVKAVEALQPPPGENPPPPMRRDVSAAADDKAAR